MKFNVRYLSANIKRMVIFKSFVRTRNIKTKVNAEEINPGILQVHPLSSKICFVAANILIWL